MYGAIRQDLANAARRDPRGGPVQERARLDLAAAGPRRRPGPDRRPEHVRQQLPRPGRIIPRSSRPPTRPSTTGATAWPRCGSSAARSSRTRNSSRRSPSSSGPKTRSSTRRASTPTAACSRRSSGAEDAVISDELNHASIIDGIRLCKAQRLRYKNNDMADLEAKLGGGRRTPASADRHRRRLLDGRHHRRS